MIAWQTWSPSLFDESRRQGKPLLLDIFGTWCYWCRRMDEDTYDNDAVAALIGDRFIPVKVDTDTFPHINDRYNQGGWPTTVVIDGDGRLIDGALYLGPHDMIAFLLRSLSRSAPHDTYEYKPAIQREPFEHIVTTVVDTLDRSFDPVFGGFGSEPKFPPVDAVEFLLTYGQSINHASSLSMATTTLDSMLGIYDEHDGGFFRYATTQSWTFPHYEKMFDTNAGLMRIYASAYKIIGNDKYRNIALGIAHYIMSTLSGAYFYPSQTADETYYHARDRSQHEQPAVDMKFLATVNGMGVRAFLDVGEMLNDDGMKSKALAILDFTAQQLWTPHGYKHCTDGIPLLSDQAHMLAAFLAAWNATRRDGYVSRARKIASVIVEHFMDNDVLSDVVPRDRGVLSILHPFHDNVLVARCLLDPVLDTVYRESARNILSSLTGVYRHYGYLSADYAFAVMKFIEPSGLQRT